MKELLERILPKTDNEIVELICKSELCLEKNDLIEMFNKFDCSKVIKRFNTKHLKRCLSNINVDNADTLIKARQVFRRQKREIGILLERDPHNEELKTLEYICDIIDRSCYDMLKRNQNVVAMLDNLSK